MSTTLSPNMSLPVPNVGQEGGPDYAIDVNSSLTIIDQHTHAPGSGVAITPSAIDINTALTFNNQFATNLAGLTLTAQTTTPGISTMYQGGTDLYFVDGLGNNVRITQSGGIAGSPGTIASLTSPASATYVSASSTFVWQSDVSKAANMDFGSAIFRNLTPNSTFAVTLQPPAALSSNYSLTLPVLPSSQKIMTLDAAGVMAAPYTIDGSSLEIASNVIQIKNLGVTTAKLAAQAVTTPKIAPLAVTSAEIALNTISDTQIVIGGISNASISDLATSKLTGVSTQSVTNFLGFSPSLLTSYVPISGFAGLSYTAQANNRYFIVNIAATADPGTVSSSVPDSIFFRLTENNTGSNYYVTFVTTGGAQPLNMTFIVKPPANSPNISLSGFLKAGVSGTIATFPTFALSVKELI